MTKWRKLAVCFKTGDTSFSDEEMRPVWSTEYLRERPPADGGSSSSPSGGSQEEKSPEVCMACLSYGKVGTCERWCMTKS